MKKPLNPGGCSRVLSLISEGILDYTHYRFFTQKSILRIINEFGYEVLNLKELKPDKNRILKNAKIFVFGFLSVMKYIQFGITT